MYNRMVSLKKLSLPGGTDAWKSATGVFIMSRFIILICTYMGWSRFVVNNGVYGKGSNECLVHVRRCLQSWDQFDVRFFVGIAHDGYDTYSSYVGYNPQHPYSTAFFPLYPLLIRGLAWVFGGSWAADYIASMLIANLCFFLALIFIYAIVRNDFDSSIAQRSLFFLAFNPFAVFFFLGYSESLFLLLCVAAIFLLRRGKASDWWLAGLCGAAAILTRGSGIILLFIYSFAFLQHFLPTIRAWFERKLNIFKDGHWRELLNALLPIGLIPLALAGYMFYLWIHWHNPLLFSLAEANIWGRHLTWPGEGIILAIHNLLFSAKGRNARDLIEFIFTVGPIAILVLSWKRLPLDYIVFSLALTIFSLMYLWPVHALSSAPRFLLVLFPIGVVLALWSKRPAVGKTFELLWVTFFIINTLLIVLWNWVA